MNTTAIESDFDISGPCDQCGEDNPCAFCADPFEEEVNPEDAPHPKSYWCQDCYEDRKDKI